MTKGYFCTEHQAVFFKKGKMKGHAHPIGDTGNWCNMPEGQDEVELPEETQTESKYKADPDKITSIEKQSALKSAVTWCGIKVQGGQDLRTVDVITCAVMFEGYLKSGAVTKKTDKPES